VPGDRANRSDCDASGGAHGARLRATVRGVSLRPCSSHEELLHDPVGRWMPTGSALFWCHSAELCGMAVWGRPNAADARSLMRVFDGHRHLAPRFDVLQDASAMEQIDPEALAVLLDWLRDNPHVLRDHVRERIGVIPPGVDGLTLAGIAPVLSLVSPVTILTDPRDAFVKLLPDGGEALHREVEQLVEQARGLAPAVVALRRVLAAERGALGLAAAAARIGVSARSLQRQLAAAGLSFRAVQAEARFHAAEELLRGDDKLVAVAASLGLSEDGLTQLVRARTGLTPGELRRRLRPGDR